MDFVGIRTNPDGTSFAFSAGDKRVKLSFPDEYVVTNQTATPAVDVHAPIVFVGFGIHAPELGWDDYKGVDLHGKIALVFVSQPMVEATSPFHGKPLTYYGRWTYKYEIASEKGAAAAVIRASCACSNWLRSWAKNA